MKTLMLSVLFLTLAVIFEHASRIYGDKVMMPIILAVVSGFIAGSITFKEDI